MHSQVVKRCLRDLFLATYASLILGMDAYAQSITVTDVPMIFGVRGAGYSLCFEHDRQVDPLREILDIVRDISRVDISRVLVEVTEPEPAPTVLTVPFSADMSGPCYFFAGTGVSNPLSGSGFLTNLALLSTIRGEQQTRILTQKVDRLTQQLDAHVAISNARQSFIEDQLSAELQARMDRWPAELLANRDAYEAFKTQLMLDLEEVLTAHREVSP